MINILKIILLKFFSILPDSPFQSALADMDLSFVPALNWFVPFDVCADITSVWLVCVLLYFVFMLVKGIISSLIHSKIIGAVLKVFTGV